MKKFITLILAVVLSFAMTVPVMAADYIDGNQLCSVQPRVEQGVTLVPMRAIFETLGASVDYNSSNKQITAYKGDTKIQLTLNVRSAYVNGTKYTLDIPAKAINGNTLVPLRFVSEALGANVDYNSSTKKITIVATDGTTIIFNLGSSTNSYIGTWRFTQASAYGMYVSAQELGISSALYLYSNNNAKIVIDGTSASCKWYVENGKIALKDQYGNTAFNFYISGSYLLLYQDDVTFYYRK